MMTYIHDVRMIVCLVLFLSISLARSPEAAAANQSNAAALERGSVEQRLDVLAQFLDTPIEQRDSRLWNAIEREATRMLAWHRQPGPVGDSEKEAYSAYSAGLVRALGESRDPVVIPLLIEYAGFGRYASDALVRFGDLALPAMLRAARGTQNDLGQIQGVILALGHMLSEPVPRAIAPLSDENRQAITVLAQELLATKLTFNNAVEVTVIALATGQPDMRDELERLASDREAWIRRGLVDQGLITICQQIIQVQLRKTPKP